MALALYPEHMRRFYHHSANLARLQNIAIVEAVRKLGMANYVYGGQDICPTTDPSVPLRC